MKSRAALSKPIRAMEERANLEKPGARAIMRLKRDAIRKKLRAIKQQKRVIKDKTTSLEPDELKREPWLIKCAEVSGHNPEYIDKTANMLAMCLCSTSEGVR